MNIRAIIFSVLLSIPATLSWADEHAAKLGPDGLHIQPWFYNSDFDLEADLQEAEGQNKSLLILYEQVGCIYCAELHEVNFTRDEITDVIKQGFLVVQLDLNGDRMVTDFDGEKISEGDLADKWAVTFTPTTLVFSTPEADIQSFQDAESFRLPGYLKPFYYYSVLSFFASGEYENQSFKAYLQTELAVLEVEGIDPELW